MALDSQKRRRTVQHLRPKELAIIEITHAIPTNLMVSGSKLAMAACIVLVLFNGIGSFLEEPFDVRRFIAAYLGVRSPSPVINILSY